MSTVSMLLLDGNEFKKDEVSCTCRTRCHSQKRCPCKAAKVSCTERCHPQRTCVNVPMAQAAATDLTTDTEEFMSTGPNQWTQCNGVPLTAEHKTILQSKEKWLDDTIITAAQSLLHKQFPYIEGFQKPFLGTQLAMEPQAGEFVQILCVRNSHWICVSTVGCKPSTVNVYNSLHGSLDTHTQKLVADLMQSQKKHIEVRYADVQWQSRVNDCGLFAIAFATSICSGIDPTTITFEQPIMRSHLLDCILSGKLTPFPVRNNTRRPKPFKKEYISIYCVCRLIDNGSRMVECASCLEWFHQSCARVPGRFLKNKELDCKCLNCA